MKLIVKTIAAATALFLAASCVNQQSGTLVDDTPGYTLSDDQTIVKIAEDGSLLALTNVKTGHNYASGQGLWRLFYNTHEEKEMQIDGSENVPVVSQDGNVITIAYTGLSHRG